MRAAVKESMARRMTIISLPLQARAEAFRAQLIKEGKLTEDTEEAAKPKKVTYAKKKPAKVRLASAQNTSLSASGLHLNIDESDKPTGGTYFTWATVQMFAW